MDNNKMLENAKRNSIGKDNIQKFKPNIKKILHKSLLGVLIAFLAITMIYLDSKELSKDFQEIHNKIYSSSHEVTPENEELNMYLNKKDSKVQYEMHKYGLKGYSVRGEQVTNELEDYKKIESLNETDLYHYYRVLGKKECEKVVITLGYKDWNDFLVQNNYMKDNNASMEDWIQYENNLALEKSKGYTK